MYHSKVIFDFYIAVNRSSCERLENRKCNAGIDVIVWKMSHKKYSKTRILQKYLRSDFILKIVFCIYL